MGKIQNGAFVTEIRNKVGNLIYSRNRGGAYTKAYAIPTGEATAVQVATRFRFFTVQAAWASITDAQRSNWMLAASEWPRQDNIDNTIVLSGYDLFISLNLNLSIIGASLISDPPSQASIPAITALSLIADTVSGTISIQCTPAVIPDGLTMVVAMTPPMPATQSYIKNKLRVIYQYNPGENPTTDNLVFIYLSRFTAPTAGHKVGLRVYYIHNSSGAMGERYVCTGIAT